VFPDTQFNYRLVCSEARARLYRESYFAIRNETYCEDAAITAQAFLVNSASVNKLMVADTWTNPGCKAGCSAKQ
jgi:hypothetical protein